MDEVNTVNESSNDSSVSASQQVEYLVKQLSADIDKLNQEIREQRRMVKDTLQSDSSYQEVSEKIKELNKKRREVQKELAANESVRKAKEELKELNEQKKAMQSKLSDYLRQYVETFDSKTVEDLEGNLKQIVTQYKLVKQRTSK